MGSSFVEINGRGFWAGDAVLEMFLRLLALHIVDPQKSDEPSALIRNHMLLQSRGYFLGHVSSGLNEAIKMPGGVNFVRDAIHSLDARLAELTELDGATLNVLGMTEGWGGPTMETWRLREMGRAWLALIEGKIASGPGDDYPWPGCGSSPIMDRKELL